MGELKKFGLSLLDQPIGLEAGHQRQAKEMAVRAQDQEDKKYLRTGRRAYREASRKGDHAAAMTALDRMNKEVGSTGAGLRQAGQHVGGLRRQFAMTEQQVQNFNGQPGQAPGWDQDNNGIPNSIQRPADSPASNIPTAPGATTPSRLGAPVTPGLDAGPQTPGIDAGPSTPGLDSQKPVAAPERAAGGMPLAQRVSLFERMRQTQADGGDPRAYAQEAGSMGIDEKSFENGVSRLLPKQAPAASTQTTAPAPSAFSSLIERYKGQFPGIEKLATLSPADQSAAQAQGKAAGDEVRAKQVPAPSFQTDDRPGSVQNRTDTSLAKIEALAPDRHQIAIAARHMAQDDAISTASLSRREQIDQKLTATLANYDKAFSAQQVETDEYFNRVLGEENRMAKVFSGGPLAIAFSRGRQQVAPRKEINYDSFDQAKWEAGRKSGGKPESSLMREMRAKAKAKVEGEMVAKRQAEAKIKKTASELRAKGVSERGARGLEDSKLRASRWNAFIQARLEDEQRKLQSDEQRKLQSTR